MEAGVRQEGSHTLPINRLTFLYRLDNFDVVDIRRIDCERVILKNDHTCELPYLERALPV